MVHFTTIIPAYNRVRWISACVESILSQDESGEPSPISNQIIVVDDGSTDGTAELVESKFGQAVRVIRRANGGAGAARNTGVLQATGTYLVFLDSDDLWFPWTLRMLRRALVENGEPAFLMGSPCPFADEGELPESAGPLKVESFADFYSSWLTGRFMGTSAFVVRRDVLLRIGEFAAPAAGWINFEDIDLALRLGVEKGYVLMHSPPMFAYREHLGSTWGNLDRTVNGARYIINAERESRYPGGADRRRERLETLTRNLRPVIVRCVEVGRVRDAWELYRSTFEWHLQLRRWKFLAGLPLMCARRLVRR